MAWHLLVGLAIGACWPVDGDRILVRDLAAAIPAFSSADGEQSIGLTPAPGAQRRFSAGDLIRLAALYGISAEPTPVCFARKLEALTKDRLLAALREALPPEAQVEIVDFSRVSVPQGQLEFSRQGLSTAPLFSAREPVIWRGRAKYAPAQSVPVWVKARLWVSRSGLIAVRDLPAGKPIEPAGIRLGDLEATPFSECAAASPGEVAGLAPRRLIRAGQAIPLSILEAPADVMRGEMVGVEAHSGTAFLKYEVRAEASGRVGEAVEVRNVESGKTFRAKVIRRGWVAVD
jgi:flagella basal body P-ring formation protein FlgA